MSDPRATVAAHVRFQRDGCAQLGSGLYAELLDRMASDVEAGGPSWRVLEPFSDWDRDSAYVLRLMGAVHRLVLTGEAPALAQHFGAGTDPEAAWAALAALLAERADELQQLALEHPVQTNEVGRCAALAPAMLWLSGGRPLRLLELGASAGLNLRWDLYRYENLWGDPQSTVALTDRYEGAPPPFDPPAIHIVERRGCDPRPVCPSSERGRLTLLSYVWPDQAERVRLLRGALDLAAQMPAGVEAAPADEWLERELARPPTPGAMTVVFHSIVWQYLDGLTRERIARALAGAGARATREAPLAWLRMEPDGALTRVDATLWEGGPEPRSHLVARAGYHGRPVRWLVDGEREGAGGAS